MTRADWELAFPRCQSCPPRPPMRWQRVWRRSHMVITWMWKCPHCGALESGQSIVARRARALAEPVGSVAA
jgi:hypothetical protein